MNYLVVGIVDDSGTTFRFLYSAVRLHGRTVSFVRSPTAAMKLRSRIRHGASSSSSSNSLRMNADLRRNRTSAKLTINETDVLQISDMINDFEILF